MSLVMTSRERVLTTLGNSEPDHVPVNYQANPGIDRRLKAHFGLAPIDDEGLRRVLGVDFRSVRAPYVGPPLHAEIPDRRVNPWWGYRTRWIEHDSGGYWDFCDFPLRDADEEEVARWPLPSPDDYDYAAVPPLLSANEGFAINGAAGYGDIINGNGFLRGTEQTLVDLITDNPAGLLLAQRRMSIQLEVTARTLEAARGRIDFLWLGEDLGTQIGPLISLELFRRHIRPQYQPFCDLARSYGIHVMVHTCGSSSWAYEDFIEMGVTAVDTLQPEAREMAPAYLKSRFGGRLAFHGCISTAGPVAYGTPPEVVAYCRQTLETMMPGGGYCFAPTHELQDNSPTENVLAMYETARRFGAY